MTRCGCSTCPRRPSGSARGGSTRWAGSDRAASRSMRAAPLPGELGDLVCFAGRGPGEVFLGARKVVGLTQWRAREGALFSSCAYLRWDPAPLLELMYVDAHVREGVTRDLRFGRGRPGRARSAGHRPRSRAGPPARLVPGFHVEAAAARPTAAAGLHAPRHLATSSPAFFLPALLFVPLRAPSLVPLRLCSFARSPSPVLLGPRRSSRAHPAPPAQNGPGPAPRVHPLRSAPTSRRIGWRGRGCIWVAGGSRWLCSGGKGRKVARSGVRGRQRTQARERRGRHSWWQASLGDTSTRSTRRAG